MRQPVHHAIVKEQGVTFAVISVKDHVASSPHSAQQFIAAVTPIYGCPVVVIGERSGRLYGRQDIVNFLSQIHSSQLPWRNGYINIPSSPSYGGGGSYAPSEPEQVNWVGGSGRVYTYVAYSLSALPDIEQDGNYIYAKRNAGLWIPIYVGQGDLSCRLSTEHHQWACIASKEATHAHVRINASERDRLAEEEDILSSHPMAYAPFGCNLRTGG